MASEEAKSDIELSIERQGFELHIISRHGIPERVYATRGEYRSVQVYSWQQLRDTLMADDEWEDAVRRPKRRLFWIGDEDDWGDEVLWCVTVPAEVVTDALNAGLSPLSKWGNATERNITDGMRHWHWTVNASRLDQVRAVLTTYQLIETDDHTAVW